MALRIPRIPIPAGPDRDAWKADRERIDTAAEAVRILGPPAKRSAGRDWWRCPFHDDRTPSFAVERTPGGRWRCFGCGEKGDAAALLMRLENKTFPEARAALTGGPAPAVRSRSEPRNDGGREVSDLTRPRPPTPFGPKAVPDGPSGLSADEAAALVETAAAALWTTEGAADLQALRARGLADDVIRDARIGYTPGILIPKRDGSGTYRASGTVIPWLGPDGRPALVKLRQPADGRPKYAEAYRDPARLLCYPGPAVIRPGHPVILTEGELDALCLASLLAPAGMAVITLGSASNGPARPLLPRLLAAVPWYAAHDADDAGDRAAAAWPAARRLRPPEGSTDWCDAYRADPLRLLRFLADALDRPELLAPRHRLHVGWPAMMADPEAMEERAAIQAEAAG